MGLAELFFVVLILALIVWRALSWRRDARDYKAICKDHQRTIFMQERELLDLRIYKRNLEHRAAKRAML